MISVALCTYNGGKYLGEQLDSLAAQTLLPAEVQIGDDGSTDDTAKIVERFRAPFPVRFTRNPARLGYGENFIATARRCSSPWVAFCDQDDVWLPTKLERCAAEFRDGVSLVAHNVTAELGQPLPEQPLQRVSPKLTMLPRWFCLGFCQVFRRELLDIRRVPLPWAEVPDAHDVWIPFLAGMTGDIVFIDEPLARYRHHAGNVSNDLGRVDLPDGIATMDSAAAIAAELGFAEASAHFGRYAGRLRDRRAVTEGKSVRAFLRLVAGGAYRSGGYDRFGRRAMIRDALALV